MAAIIVVGTRERDRHDSSDLPVMTGLVTSYASDNAVLYTHVCKRRRAVIACENYPSWGRRSAAKAEAKLRRRRSTLLP